MSQFKAGPSNLIDAVLQSSNYNTSFECSYWQVIYPTGTRSQIQVSGKKVRSVSSGMTSAEPLMGAFNTIGTAFSSGRECLGFMVRPNMSGKKSHCSDCLRLTYETWTQYKCDMHGWNNYAAWTYHGKGGMYSQKASAHQSWSSSSFLYPKN